MGEHIKPFYKYHDADEKHFHISQKLKQLQKLHSNLIDLRQEYCFYVASKSPLTSDEKRQVLWLIEPLSSSNDYVIVSETSSHLRQNQNSIETSLIIEVGPRLNFCSPFSTNAVSILKSSCPQTSIYRLERSIIYELIFKESVQLSSSEIKSFSDLLHDEMVETVYQRPVDTFNPQAPRAKVANGEPELQPCAQVKILELGKAALIDVNKRLGLGFDDWDMDYYVKLFRDKIKRNPTVVECFDLAQSNSEHSRHWFFKGILDIKGRSPIEESLIDMVGSTQAHSNDNNIIKFNDNSSAIKGFKNLEILKASDPSRHSKMEVIKGYRHIVLTAETHNFPTGVAPFPGAATGTGGRIRDVQATGRGAHVIAGTAGYSFGNLLLDDYELDWENPHELYPNNLAIPARIAIEASNGASDYGNKFGEPIVAGFARSFGMRLASNNSGETERWEYLKPIMFTGGVGTIDDEYVTKLKPEKNLKVAKIGGPVYRIGIGGGAASSVTDTKGDKSQSNQMNINAVQRGDPEMGQKMNRVVRACIENTSHSIDDRANMNPILAIHDQGAGGNGNVLKELVDPLGGSIEADAFTLGDHTINILELWAAEYQESNAILTCKSGKSQQFLDKVSAREKCKVEVVGKVQNDGQIRLANFSNFDEKTEMKYPIELELEHVIGSMPRKRFDLIDYSASEYLKPAKLIETEMPQLPTKSSHSRYRLLNDQAYILTNTNQMMNNFEHLLEKVLKLPSVGSKRYLTTKVDRCVTGLIAGQQCLGPLHTPINDYALVAMNYFGHGGIVTSIGEQPIKGLVSPAAGARMAVAEALTNMIFCYTDSLQDVKCSANWMWPAKLPGEGAKLVDACKAMCDLMKELGIAVDGGKDSLSMSANVDPGNSRRLIDVSSQDDDDVDEMVKCPGTLVISTYAPVPDIRLKVNPILRCTPKKSHLVYVDFSHPLDGKCDCKKFRLGGSALLQTLGQIGDESPDIDHPELLRDGYEIIKHLISTQAITAGHDVSDGGLIVCAIEMALASHCGIHLNIKAEKSFRELSLSNNEELILAALFAEECGIIIEVQAESESDLESKLDMLHDKNIQAQRIGFASYEKTGITVKFEQQLLLEHKDNRKLREFWESTSRQLDLRQANPKCIMEEYDNMSSRPSKPDWKLTFDPNKLPCVLDLHAPRNVRVAVLREEGTNGDREMISSLINAGFDVFDVTVTDLISKYDKADLNVFQGLIFPGGFSYADVFGSGRGWAASLIFNRELHEQLQVFRRRKNTFSFGVCNGCQLMSLLGFLENIPDSKSNKLVDIPNTTVRLEPNDSGRFECRFVNVRIEPTTNAIMLKGMQESSLGVWVAHGEGKFKIEQSVEVEKDFRIAIKYVDDKNEPTMEYPLNPNGSDQATAAMCSMDGRHLAMMPHPERCTKMWQFPYAPFNWTDGSQSMKISPWMKIFTNAYEFCMQND